MNDPYDLVTDIFTNIWPKYEQSGYDGLTESDQVIFCTWQFVCEVNNGGFSQYFSNPSGEFALEAIEALEKVGMTYAASLLRRAIEGFPDSKPLKDHTLRGEQLVAMPDMIDDMFHELTQAFFKSSEDPYQLQADYITTKT